MRHQKGASYFSILFAIVGFAFIAKVAIAVWGPYWDDRVIDSQIEELIAANSKETPEKFVQQLGQRLEMNNIRDFDIKENIEVANKGGLSVHKSYEVRKNFVMNVDLIMKFEKDFGQSASQAK